MTKSRGIGSYAAIGGLTDVAEMLAGQRGTIITASAGETEFRED